MIHNLIDPNYCMNQQECLTCPHSDYEGKNNLDLGVRINNTLVKLDLDVNWCPIQWIFPGFHEVQTPIAIYLPKLHPDALSHQTVSEFRRSSLSHIHQRAAFDKDSKNSKPV